MKKIMLTGFCAVTLAAVPGCEIDNPTAATVDTADPVMLLRGARSKFSDAMGMIGGTFVASDEGLAKTGSQVEDQTGQISASGAYTTWYSQVHQARRLAAFAIDRADALGETQNSLLAHVWHGWMHIRLAELWGAQPFDGGAVVPYDEILSRGLAEVESATAATADSTRHRAFAGIARVNYIRGRAPVNNGQLTAAIAAAQTVLSQNANFLWVEEPNFNPLNFNMGRAYGPTPFYRDIPFWFAGFPALAGHDNTLIFNDATKPRGVVVISATELRMIQAHSHLLLGDLASAKTAFKAAPLLPTNHVRVCRPDPRAPAITAAQIAACVDPMTEPELAAAIDAINREDQYISARRPIKEDGAVIMPFTIPPTA